tara:strand:+ start:16321 stop:16539 length:219 start_codon:yes stop_codon:yes gene_type:complete
MGGTTQNEVKGVVLFSDHALRDAQGRATLSLQSTLLSASPDTPLETNVSVQEAVRVVGPRRSGIDCISQIVA